MKKLLLHVFSACALMFIGQAALADDCGSLKKYEARQACKGDCSAISDYSTRQVCKGDCSSISDYALRQACKKDCSSLSSYEAREACKSCGGGAEWAMFYMLRVKQTCSSR
ncbi:hypothetical protein SAMN05660284_02822 [Formivibrio citricus]|uniref:Uncharacterized protein n=1 Tax=Formivibrio citricus TaxID=83765 RepID=A0A1I5E2S4_9NEIS|nr:hypothetical protein [Formivibrio citricus]SFO05819.1 hypothetical protein SAMN05660284_02822 [Formivibrio citricus]